MTLSEENFSYLRTLMHEQIAISLAPDKAYLASARLSGLAHQFAGGNVDRLVEIARDRHDSPLRREIIEALAIHETFFFRDPLLQECLEDVLPALIVRNRSARTLRLWSAACSTGQEAYSVALLLREKFPELADWRIEFTASDFSRTVLQRAREGTYGINEVNRGLPTRLLVKWFEQKGLSWQAKPTLRAMIDFREINLAGAWPADLPRFDVILLRNVLIYFPEEIRMRLLGRMRAQLVAGGYLLLGATENLGKGQGFVPATPGSHRPCYQIEGG